MHLRGVTIIKPNENTLILKKNNNEKANDWVSTFVGFLIFPGLLILLLFSGQLLENPGFTFYVISIGLFIVVMGMAITNVIELLVNNRDYIIEKNANSIMINSRSFATNKYPPVIVVRPQRGEEGIGESFFVGIEGKEFYPLVFYQDQEGAAHISNTLAEFLDLKIVRKQARLVSFLKWH